MRTNRLQQLYTAYMENRLDAAGTRELWVLLADPAHEAAVKELMDGQFNNPVAGQLQNEAAAEAMLADITALPQEKQEEQETQQTKRRRFPLQWAAAALLILAAGTGTYFYMQPAGNQQQTNMAATNDAKPGMQGAILTLSNGQQVQLDSLGNTTLATQGGTQLAVQNGQLVYTPVSDEPGTLVYNTISTPRGRQYSVTLPDGTKAWLNAASSLRYPVMFNTTDRRVEVTGEVYFEVAQQASKPFFVTVTQGPEIQVLGTSFNINAYQEEYMLRTTLLTGSIKVLFPDVSQPVLLKPGQQVSLHRKTGHLDVKEANTEQVMAWKNGNFYFEREDLRSILRELSRWYNVNVVYDKLPAKTFSGTIPRNVNASQVFKILESTNNVHFKIEGDQVTVEQ